MNNELTHLYLRVSKESSDSIVEEAISKGVMNFILDEGALVEEIKAASFFRLSNSTPMKEARLVSNIADCMNAEQEKADLILWDTDNFLDLESLIPIKAPYGWMILSLNTPVLVDVDKVQEGKDIENTDLAGFYSYKLEDLLASQFTNKKLKSE